MLPDLKHSNSYFFFLHHRLYLPKELLAPAFQESLCNTHYLTPAKFSNINFVISQQHEVTCCISEDIARRGSAPRGKIKPLRRPHNLDFISQNKQFTIKVNKRMTFFLLPFFYFYFYLHNFYTVCLFPIRLTATICCKMQIKA